MIGRETVGVALFLLLSGSASAQRERPGPLIDNPRQLYMETLENPHYLSLLELSEEEAATVKLLVAELEEGDREYVAKRNAEARNSAERGRAAYNRLIEIDKQIQSALGQKYPLFKRVHWQVLGVARARSIPEFRERMKLSKAQDDEMRLRIREASGLREMRRVAAGGTIALYEDIRARDQNAREIVWELLTEIQKNTWKEMIGEPIEGLKRPSELKLDEALKAKEKREQEIRDKEDAKKEKKPQEENGQAS